jgi:hypothetical protein
MKQASCQNLGRLFAVLSGLEVQMIILQVDADEFFGESGLKLSKFFFFVNKKKQKNFDLLKHLAPRSP